MTVVVVEELVEGIAVVDVGNVASGSGLSIEQAVDAVADALVAGENVTVLYDDDLNTITISATGTGGGGAAGPAGYATFTYVATTVEPPTGAQLRLNSATPTSATRMWVMETDVDGADVSTVLARIGIGWQLYLQDNDDATRWVIYNVAANPTDDGTYLDIPVSLHDSSGVALLAAQQVDLQPVPPASVGIPTGGTVGQVLTKGSSSNFAADWATPTGGGGGGGITTDDAIDAVQAAISATAPIVVTKDTPTAQTIVLSAPTVYYQGAATDVSVADGGTGASTAAAARTNLGAASTATFTTAAAGLVPAGSGGSTTVQFLRKDGSWSVPSAASATITVAESGVTLDTDIATLDFEAGFALAQSPDTVCNVSLDLSEYAGAALPQTGVANLTADLAAKVTNGGGAATIVALTQAAYNALTPDPTTLYIIL